MRAAGTLLQLGAGESLTTSLQAVAYEAISPAVAVCGDGTVDIAQP